MTAEFRTKVDRLRERLPAYSIQECQNALLAYGEDHDKAREKLFRDFNRDAFVSAFRPFLPPTSSQSCSDFPNEIMSIKSKLRL